MKKIVLLLALIAIAGSMVWAQYTPPTAEFPKSKPYDSVFPGFSAMGLKSVENKYAPGFNTMVEDYIHPAFYNPDINTFLLLGGEGRGPIKDGSIALGFAQTFGPVYAAAFYRGSIFGTSGSSSGSGVTTSNPNDSDSIYKSSSIIWNNTIALLIGIANMGFGIDIIDNDLDDTRTTYDGNNTITETMVNGIKFALSWGANFGNLYPNAKIGFKTPNISTVGGVQLSDSALGQNFGKNATKSSGGAFYLEAGGLFDLAGGSFTDMLIGKLYFGLQFKESYKGDSEVITQFSDYNEALANGKEYSHGGAWGLGMEFSYRKTFEFDKLSLKITPNLKMDIVGQSEDNSIDKKKNPVPVWFTLAPGLELGLKIQPIEKLAFFTGIDLMLFRLNTYAIFKGDLIAEGGGTTAGKNATLWNVEGMLWNMGSTFGLGMAWYPVEGLVVSAGLNSLLNAFFVLDMQNMSIESGSLFTNTNANNVGDWLMLSLGKLFTSFALTITYTF